MKKTLITLISLHIFYNLTVLAQKMEPTEKLALLIVQVINPEQKAQIGEQVTFENTVSKQVFSGITKENGMFEVLVPKGEKYSVKYKAFTSEASYTILDVPNVKDELLSFDVVIQIELPKKYKLENVYFETGKTTLTTSSFKELDELVEYLALRKAISIEIAGHTDNVGTPETNLKLSHERAIIVRAYLIKKGITENRIIAKGYGDSQPIALNDTDAGKQKNRRTEVRIIKE
jgi:OmpA-OmpF porin, OOP family